MDKSREAFELWLYDPKMPFLRDEEIRQAFWSAWQAAWEARGKHDAEICRNNAERFYYGSEADACEECAQAIEEQG